MSVAVSEDERRKKSVYYEACTSPFKDDFATLVKCLRTPEPGNPHTRQEAGFLLWHHALAGDSSSGLLAAGLLPACVANLDSAELLPADKACSAGILLALAGDDEEVAEQLVRTRGPTGRSALEVLHAVLSDDEALARHHCGRLLQALAVQVAPVVLRAMDNELPYMGSYLTVWGIKEHRDAPAVAAVGELVAALLEQRPEMAPTVVAGGGVVALLDVLRNHKSEAAVGAALTCLGRLLPLEPAVEQLEGLGGVPLLVDVLGPPPRAALENRPEEVEEEAPLSPSPSALEPPSPSALAAAVSFAATSPSRSTDGGAEDAGGGDSAAADPDSAHGATQRISFALRTLGSHPSVGLRVQLPLVIPRIQSPSAAAAAAAAEGGPQRLPPLLPSSSTSTPRGIKKAYRVTGADQVPAPDGAASGAAAADAAGAGAAGADAAAAAVTAAALAPLPLPSAADLSLNRSGLRWFMLPGLEVASRAAACLTQVVVQRPASHTRVLELRYASHRLLAQLRAAVGPKAVAPAAEGSGPAKTKSRKKGLGLTAEQTAGLARLMGLLKFLSLHNTTRYRIARLGAVPILVRLYGEAGDYLLRNHCQAILANAALLAENGAVLREAGTPEEFLVANPMRLTPYERAVLRIEFPDDPALLARR